MGGVCVVFGLYYALKPLLAARMLTRRRRASGRADREIEVTLDHRGVVIGHGEVSTRLGWDEVVAAGRGPSYVWYELRGGQRATIPLRAVEDPDALVEILRARTEWVG